MVRPNIVQVGSPRPAYYNDLLMRANPMLHEESISLLLQFAPTGSTAIDLGAGQGAFSARLRDSGYEVTAVDKNLADFKADGVDFVALDLEDDAAVDDLRNRLRESFDVAIGMEVIEHVENPWSYVQLLLDLVRPGGIVLITTPNAESSYSRFEFLFSGKFLHFGDSDYSESGHINPLTFHELQLISNESPAETLALESICPLPWIVVSRRIRVTVKSILASLLRPFVGDRGRGDAICLVLKKHNA